jgi:hypothetical protein
MLRSWQKAWVRGLALAASVTTAQPAWPQDDTVDVALILAIDCSFSVDSNEYRLQMEGLGQALLGPEILEAIKHSPHQQMAILVMQWSDQDNQQVVLPWTKISTVADINYVAAKLGSAPRQLAEGGTSMSSALAFAAVQFSNAPKAERRVIDLSTDGRNNIGLPVRVVRDKIVSEGITINGLAIRNEWPTLDIYLDAQVAGGPSYFVMSTDTYADFGVVMRRKLLKEITGPGIS